MARELTRQIFQLAKTYCCSEKIAAVKPQEIQDNCRVNNKKNRNDSQGS